MADDVAADGSAPVAERPERSKSPDRFNQDDTDLNDISIGSPGPTQPATADVALEGGNDNAGGGTDDGNGHGPAPASSPSRPPPRTADSFLSLPKKKSGLCGASFNLINSIVGAGIIGIPYAFLQSGFIAGLILLALVAFLTDRSLRVIINLSAFHPVLKKCRVKTFEQLASYPFGRVGKAFVLVNMLVMAYGAMVAYLIIIKDTVPTILGIGSGIGREVTLVLFSLLIMVPLSMQRDMASLSFSSLVSISADVVLVIFVAAFAPIKETVASAGGFGRVLAEGWINPNLFVGLGILSTAMACQHSAFIVSGSLENRTKRRWATVTVSSISISALLCAVMGLCGYLGFLGETRGNILNNFEDGSVAANAARCLLAITMFFTYPMESFVARHVFVMLVHKGDMDATYNERGRDGGGCLFLNRRQLWTLGLYGMALLPALFIDDIGPVLSITGSIGGSCISYIAPGLCYLGVNGDAFLEICSNLIGKPSGGAKGVEGQIELPVAGDANQRMAEDGTTSQDLELPVEGEHRDLTTAPTIPSGCKPIWWYPLGFPLWSGIAMLGSRGVRVKLANADSPTVSDDADDVDDEYSPTRGGFCMAIFFIVFGIVAALAGILSNIFLQYSAVAY